MKIRFRVFYGKKMWYPEDERKTGKWDAEFFVSQEGDVHDMVWSDNDADMPILIDAPTIPVTMLSIGRKDQNGKEIYEGDIMAFINPKSKDQYERIVGYVIFEEGQFKVQCNRRAYYIQDMEASRVVGNVHEDHELMEE